MELKLKKIAASELDSGARMILASKNQPFFFLWYHGEILMNKQMKGIRKTTEALRVMWKYDFLDQSALDEGDAAYDVIKESSGDAAARQALAAWSKAAEISKREKGKAAAQKWYKEVYQELDEDTWDEIYANGYCSEFLLGIVDAYYNARQENEQLFKVQAQTSDRAIFVYGFLLGKQAAASASAAAHGAGQEVMR